MEKLSFCRLFLLPNANSLEYTVCESSILNLSAISNLLETRIGGLRRTISAFTNESFITRADSSDWAKLAQWINCGTSARRLLFLLRLSSSTIVDRRTSSVTIITLNRPAVYAGVISKADANKNFRGTISSGTSLRRARPRIWDTSIMTAYLI